MEWKVSSEYDKKNQRKVKDHKCSSFRTELVGQILNDGESAKKKKKTPHHNENKPCSGGLDSTLTTAGRETNFDC